VTTADLLAVVERRLATARREYASTPHWRWRLVLVRTRRLEKIRDYLAYRMGREDVGEGRR
jgi:hypothetical protein